MTCPALNDSCTYFEPSRNEYGDFNYGVGTVLNCRAREINDLTRGNDYREELDADAMFWFLPNSIVQLGGIILYRDNYYRIDTITEARKFDTEVHFKKCLVVRHRQVS